MSSDHPPCASSPRGGLSKALKDMKSKVATRTGMSLTFVELVATSPAVVLLPLLSPSPRSPSARLHRWMHPHSSFSHTLSSPSSTRRSSTEASSCSDAEVVMETSKCDVHGMGMPICCDDSQPSLSWSGMPRRHSSTSCVNPPSPSSSSLSCLYPPSSSPSSYGYPPLASLCDAACGHSTLPSHLGDMSCTQQRKSVRDSLVHAGHTNGDTSAVEISCKQETYLLDRTWGSISSARMWAHARNIVIRATRLALYITLTLVFGLISLTKSFKYDVRVISNAGAANALNEVDKEVETYPVETSKVDTAAEHQMSRASNRSGRQRSQVLKNKLRSSFKNLSVQVPCKAFAPLHLNTPSLSLSSSSQSPSPSPACSCSPTRKKNRMPRSPGFARRLTKSFNQRTSHCSPTSDICFSPPSCQHEVEQQTSERSTKLTNSCNTMITSLVSVPLALCGLFFGKLVAGGIVTTWLLILSMASNTWLGRRALSPQHQT